MTDNSKHWQVSYSRFIPSRYPYTYAYDLLRQEQPLQGDNSRGEVSGYVTEHCLVKGIDKEAFCYKLADIYLQYEVALVKAELEMKENLSYLLSQKE